MEYVVVKRFKGVSIGGWVNIPFGAICEKKDGVLYYNNTPICIAISENAHNHFMRNDDGNGLERGKVIRSIKDNLSKRDCFYQVRWDAVWEDTTCQKYKMKEHPDHWIWNHAFYNADIEALRHIDELIKRATNLQKRKGGQSVL